MKCFTEHPNSVGETYFEHFKAAAKFGFKFLRLARCAFTHALFPWLHENTASECVKELHEVMNNRNSTES